MCMYDYSLLNKVHPSSVGIIINSEYLRVYLGTVVRFLCVNTWPYLQHLILA
jgi:hypothetical protein